MFILPCDSESGPGMLDPERRSLTIGLLLSVSLVAFEAMAVATVLPVAVDDLGWRDLYGWAFSAFMLTSLVAAIAASRRADERGPATPFAAGVVLFGCGLLLAGIAPSMPVFIGARALQGLGAGAISAMAYVSIGRGYPDTIRARMMALLSSAWVVPALIGPAIAGMLADHVTWRAVFLGLLPLLVVSGVLALTPLRHLAVEHPVEPNFGRLRLGLRLVAGTGLVLAGLELSVLVPALVLVVGGLALAVPALRRLLPPGTLRAERGLPAGLAVRGLLNFSYFGAEAFLPLGLTSLRGQTTAQAGVTLTVAALSWTAGSWMQARLDWRDEGCGRRGRVRTGLALIVGGGAVMAVAVLTSHLPVELAAVGWGTAGVGMGLAYPSISLIALRHAPPGQEGEVSGSMQVAELLSVAAAAGLGSALITFGRSLGWPEQAGIGAAFSLMLAVGLVGLVATQRLSAGFEAASNADLITAGTGATAAT